MLKFLVCMFITTVLSVDASAEILKFTSGRDGQSYEAKVTSNERAGSVSFYQDGKLLGTYDNLIVNESSLSSTLVPAIGGGVALEIESNGSRSKYDILAPIKFIDGKLYIECLYKNVYDSVEEERSVGAICQRRELSQFDVSASINSANLSLYTAKHNWLKSLPPGLCSNAVGLEIGSYRIARCAQGGASETIKQKIIALDRQNKLIFSATGYEFIPLKDGSAFVLAANLNNDAVIFKGDFSCYQSTLTASDVAGGTAKIGGNISINYSIGMTGKCLGGTYSYAKRNKGIILRGNETGDVYYMLEMDAKRVSSGVFMLDQIKDRIRGQWVGVPPKGPFAVTP